MQNAKYNYLTNSTWHGCIFKSRQLPYCNSIKMVIEIQTKTKEKKIKSSLVGNQLSTSNVHCTIIEDAHRQLNFKCCMNIEFIRHSANERRAEENLFQCTINRKTVKIFYQNVIDNMQQPSTKKKCEKYIKSESRKISKCNEHSFFRFCSAWTGSWVSDNVVLFGEFGHTMHFDVDAMMVMEKNLIFNEHYVFFFSSEH